MRETKVPARSVLRLARMTEFQVYVELRPKPRGLSRGGSKGESVMVNVRSGGGYNSRQVSHRYEPR